MRCSRADSAGPVVGQGACPFAPPPDNYSDADGWIKVTKKAPPQRDQLVLPTKEPLDAVGHPFVYFGFLIWRQAHEFLGRGIADKLLHLLGFFALLEFRKGCDAFVLRSAA